MWLLDANMDVHLLALLKEFGVQSEAATRREWAALDNGDLVAAAAHAGFRCILTQDRRFALSAATALKAIPQFSVVVVRLPQQPWRGEYGQQFRAAWTASPIRPVPGQITQWP